jgi:chitodextrinase
LNRRPEVSLLAPDPGSEHLVKTPVTFDARGRDPDGGDVEFRWSFDDGTTEVGPRVTHSFSEAGTYTVVLDVTDEEQSTTQTTITVQVMDLDPTAEIILPAHDEAYLVGREVEFEAQGSDPDGGDVEYRWDFDDGSTAFGPSATHTFGERGTYDVTLTITDDEGSTSEARLAVEIRSPGVVDIIVATVQSLSPTERVFIAGALLGVPGLVWGYLKRRRRRERAAADAE